LRLRWTTGALADLENHWQFLAERSVDHADRVEARINDRADTLKRFPYLGRLDKRTGTRFLSIPDIQFLIDYHIDDDEVRILQVWSTRQGRGGSA
jgi:plasmid stabilization system protein ParE